MATVPHGQPSSFQEKYHCRRKPARDKLCHTFSYKIMKVSKNIYSNYITSENCYITVECCKFRIRQKFMMKISWNTSIPHLNYHVYIFSFPFINLSSQLQNTITELIARWLMHLISCNFLQIACKETNYLELVIKFLVGSWKFWCLFYISYESSFWK